MSWKKKDDGVNSHWLCSPESSTESIPQLFSNPSGWQVTVIRMRLCCRCVRVRRLGCDDWSFSVCRADASLVQNDNWNTKTPEIGVKDEQYLTRNTDYNVPNRQQRRRRLSALKGVFECTRSREMLGWKDERGEVRRQFMGRAILDFR